MTEVHVRPRTGWSRVQGYLGEIIIATALLHLAVGVIFYSAPLAAIFAAGVIDTVGTNPERDAALWFMVAGVLIGLLGVLVRAMQRQGQRLPAALGWGLLLLSLVGAAILPASGFWLLLVEGLLLIGASRRAALA